ncbi:MAG: hypothetical protein IT548_12850 [Alphaproteobacteria bacterium]|nr:hypothetical protein [Alphaproteobacteria bacterium]
MGGNGLYMLYDPNGWYLAVPGVPRTGPFNQHFIRDIGLIYVLIGAAFAGGAYTAQRTALWAAATLWLAGHALFHLWEVAAGLCGADAIPRDFPGVTVPALLGLALTAWSVRNPAR